MSGALVFTSGAMVFAAATQGIPLDHLASVARGACISGPYRTVIIKETVLGRLSPPRH